MRLIRNCDEDRRGRSTNLSAWNVNKSANSGFWNVLQFDLESVLMLSSAFDHLVIELCAMEISIEVSICFDRASLGSGAVL